MRLWNSIDTSLDEAHKGMMRMYPGMYKRLDTPYGYGMYLAKMQPKCVRVIINGGGGFGPMWGAMAAPGLADGEMSGYFAAAPNAYVLYEMAKTIDDGCGVLLLTNRFMGDYLNNDMALELLEQEGIAAKAVYATDDIFSCLGEPRENRGGLSGIGQICKAASAAAHAGCSLDEVYRIASKTNDRLRSATVNVRDGQMFFGEGFSGEPAVHTFPFESVRDMMRRLMDYLLAELPMTDGDQVYLMLNKHARVSFTEECLLLENAAEELEKRGVQICGCASGCALDNFEENGFIVNLVACDQELREYLKPVTGHGFRL